MFKTISKTFVLTVYIKDAVHGDQKRRSFGCDSYSLKILPLKQRPGSFCECDGGVIKIDDKGTHPIRLHILNGRKSFRANVNYKFTLCRVNMKVAMS